MRQPVPVPPFNAIVLAGGRARRLGGVDKPALVIGGRPLVDAVVDAASTAGAASVVVVGPPRGHADRSLRFVREDPPGAGPVPALRRGLVELDGRDEAWVAVLAADLPFIRATHLTTLLRAVAAPEIGVTAPEVAEETDAGSGAVLVDDTGWPQWLVGCWRVASLRRAAAAYRQTSLRGLFAPLAPLLVAIRPAQGEPPPWLDCDTPDDVRRAGGWPVHPSR